MRLLIVLLLVAYQFSAFAGTDKSFLLANPHLYNAIANDILQISESSSIEKFSAEVTHLHYLKNTPHYRQYLLSRNTNSPLTTKNKIFLIRNTFFVTPDFYHKPIALLLIFPQHYFW